MIRREGVHDHIDNVVPLKYQKAEASDSLSLGRAEKKELRVQ